MPAKKNPDANLGKGTHPGQLTTDPLQGVGDNGADGERQPDQTLGTFTGTQVTVVIAVLVIYVASLLLLYINRADPYWDRTLFLLSGLESLVFPAATLMFGVALGRGYAQRAGDDAKMAREEARRERGAAAAFEKRAETAETVVRSVRSLKMPAEGQPPKTPQTWERNGHGEARRQDAAVPNIDPEGRLLSLIELVELLYPSNP